MGAGLEGGQLLADIEKRGYTLENSLGLGEVGKGALKAVFYWVLSHIIFIGKAPPPPSITNSL